MLGIVAVAYLTVLAAEVLGDKSIYTVGSLCTRFRAAHVFAGVSVAFGAKMAVAVLAGEAIAKLPAAWVAAVTAATFLATAILLWRRRPEAPAAAAVAAWPRATAASFGAIVLTEWGDVGQATAAAVTARFGHPLAVWCSVTAAMMTKAGVAVLIGTTLRRRFSEDRLRRFSAVLCLLLAILTVARVHP